MGGLYIGLPKVSDETIAAINKVLFENKVILFRDQGHLDDAERKLLLSDWESWFRIRRSAKSKVCCAALALVALCRA